MACLPAFALFLLTACGLLRRANPVMVLLVFGLCAAFAAYSAVNLLASTYGNTWIPGEILHALFLNNQGLGLTPVPGLGLLSLLERLNRLRP